MALDYAPQNRWPAGSELAPRLFSGIQDATGLVRIEAGGFWDTATVDRYFQVQRAVNNEARRRFGYLRVIFDLSAAIAQAADTVDHLTQGNREIYAPGDRIALIAPSAMIRIQLRRLFLIGTVQTFDNLVAAERWIAGKAE